MAEYQIVRFYDRVESLPGLKTREVVRAEIMVGEHGPFDLTVEKKEGWERELRSLAEDQVRRVRSVTT